MVTDAQDTTCHMERTAGPRSSGRQRRRALPRPSGIPAGRPVRRTSAGHDQSPRTANTSVTGDASGGPATVTR
jgi:hypothetical protein